MTLRQQIQSLFVLYGQRNAMYMRGDDRLLFLLNAVRALGKHIRKNETDQVVLASALASVFARASAYADSFVNLDIVGALEAKYPPGHCAYCLSLPCSCQANRKNNITCEAVTGKQDDWSVSDWCAHIEKVYGAVNRERGLQFALGRLYEEVCEAVDTGFLDTNNPELDLEEVRHRMSHEFADIFAWIFTLATLLNVGQLQPILDKRYNGNCRRCEVRPCKCGHFSIDVLLRQQGPAESRVAH